HLIRIVRVRSLYFVAVAKDAGSETPWRTRWLTDAEAQRLGHFHPIDRVRQRLAYCQVVQRWLLDVAVADEMQGPHPGTIVPGQMLDRLYRRKLAGGHFMHRVQRAG